MADPLYSGTTKTLLIVYHSMTGGTRQMVEAAARGSASEPTVRVRLLPALVAQAADLLGADGYLFGTPENLAAMAGLMKDFFDRT
jgi:multimeric flavodoxin WrbA